MLINTNNQKIQNLQVNNNKPVEKKDVEGEKVTIGEHHSFSLSDKLKELKNKMGNIASALIVGTLDIRVPTTTKNITEERKQKILDTIKPGDVILETNNAYPNWQRLEMVTMGSDYTHAAIYEGNGKFLEATTGDPSGVGVMRSDLKEYLEGPILIEVIRPPYKSPEDTEKVLDKCRAQLGKPYDAAFNMKDDSAYCCVELVQDGLKEVGLDAPMRKLFGKEVVGPDDFEKVKGSEIVYSDNSNFWKNMTTHYPIATAAVTTAVLGGMALGPAGAIGGFVTGLLTSIAVGNKIQTGHGNLWGENMSQYK